jgi:hypothetical protein
MIVKSAQLAAMGAESLSIHSLLSPTPSQLFWPELATSLLWHITGNFFFLFYKLY